MVDPTMAESTTNQQGVMALPREAKPIKCGQCGHRTWDHLRCEQCGRDTHHIQELTPPPAPTLQQDLDEQKRAAGHAAFWLGCLLVCLLGIGGYVAETYGRRPYLQGCNEGRAAGHSFAKRTIADPMPDMLFNQQVASYTELRHHELESVSLTYWIGWQRAFDDAAHEDLAARERLGSDGVWRSKSVR